MSCAGLLLLACLSMVAASSAAAETLRDALIAAYRTNPGLDAERARLRATDENVPRARSGYRPTITGEASIGRQNTTTTPESRSSGTTNPTNWRVSVRQPVFDGFRTSSAVNAAEAGVRAGRAQLGDREAMTLLEAVRAYMNVVRDQAILGLREKNVRVLTRELAGTQARRAVREVTLTDVAQARARRARAVSAADLAKSNLRIARAEYRRVIGHEPREISEPPLSTRGMPESFSEAHRIAEQENPRLIAALYQERSARHTVGQIWGELLPQVDLEADYNHDTEVNATLDRRSSASITGRVRIPLYRGGAVHARVRQAKHTHVSRIQEIEATRTQIEADVTAAWSRLEAARAQLRSDEVQVSAARTALRGVREEEKVGQRTLLDVLNAEQELLDARVTLVTTRRDLVVAAYTVLAAIGRLSAENIELDTDTYAPEVHYEEVRRKWAGVTITRAESYEEPTFFDVVEEPLPPVTKRRRSYSKRHKFDRTASETDQANGNETLLNRLFRSSYLGENEITTGSVAKSGERHEPPPPAKRRRLPTSLEKGAGLRLRSSLD